MERFYGLFFSMLYIIFVYFVLVRIQFKKRRLYCILVSGQQLFLELLVKFNFGFFGMCSIVSVDVENIILIMKMGKC